MLDQGYGIMPNKVLFDTKISSTSKLVFCLISSLTAQTGKCVATNAYIGEQLGIKKRQVASCISKLSEYIECTMITSEKREIKLIHNVYKDRKKMHTPMQKNAYPHAENDYHNTITNIINKKSFAEKEIERKYCRKKTILPNFVLDRVK